MINEKTVKRVEFASEYLGDDFVQNPQLRFMIAKSIEPMEIRHKLQKARQVQQAIIMQTEQNFTRLDEETYANLQPKVFRREPDQDFKRMKVLDDKEIAILEAKKQKKLMMQRMLEEKKKYEVDVRQKGKSTLSYSHFFKPPKPIATLAKLQFQAQQPKNEEESNQQRQSSSVDALKRTIVSNFSQSFMTSSPSKGQTQALSNLQRRQQANLARSQESDVLAGNRSEKELTAYERRQLGLDGNKRVLSSIQYAVMQDVNPDLRRQAIQMIVKQARSMNPDKKGILKPVAGLKAPANHKEALDKPKPYRYYGERSIEDSDLEEEEPQDQKMIRELNTLMREYDDEGQAKKLKDRIVKNPKLNQKAQDLKYSLKNNRLGYDEKLEQVREEIQKQKEQVRSRNQPLDPGPQFPFIGDTFEGRNRNLNDLDSTSNIIDLSSLQRSTKQQITRLETFDSYVSQTAPQNEGIDLLSFRMSKQAQNQTLNSTLDLIKQPPSKEKFQQKDLNRRLDIQVSPFNPHESKIDVRQSLESLPSLNSQVKIDIRRGHRAEMPTRNQSLYQQYSTQMHSKELNDSLSRDDNFHGRFTATLTQSSEESSSPLRISGRNYLQSQANTNPVTTLNNSLESFPFIGSVPRDHSQGDLIDIRNQQETFDASMDHSFKKNSKSPFSYQEPISRHTSRQVKFKIGKSNFDTPSKSSIQKEDHLSIIRSSKGTQRSSQKRSQKEDSQYLTTPQYSSKNVRLPSLSPHKSGNLNSQEPLRNIDWANLSDSTPALRLKEQEKKKDQLLNRNPQSQTTSKKLAIDSSGRIIISEAESYQHLQNSLPKIRLKSLKKTHDDFVAEQQKRFELEGREEHAMLMHKKQKEYFVKESKGGNKQYRVADHYENDVMILKPVVDASDKEIFKRNGMSSAAEQLKQLVNAKERLLNQDKTFLPNNFGQESEPKNIGHKIVRNKIKQPPTAEEIEHGKSDLNEDREIIIKRQVDQLYQKMGYKLTNMLIHPVTMKMNLKLASHFTGKVKVENMSDQEKEKRIRAYLFDRISEQMERHENKNLTRQQLQQIDEVFESDNETNRKHKAIPEPVQDDEVNLDELFLRHYEELRKQQESFQKRNLNKAYKKSVARQVKLGMIRGKYYDPQHKRDKGGLRHRGGDSVIEQINWQFDLEAHKKQKVKIEEEESSDEEGGGLRANKKVKQLEFKQVLLKNEDDLNKASEQAIQKEKNEKKKNTKRLKDQIILVRDEEEKNFLRKILEEREAMEKNFHKMTKQMREEQQKQRRLNNDEDSDFSNLESDEEREEQQGVYLFELDQEIQKLEQIEREKEADQVKGQIAKGLKEGLLRFGTKKKESEAKPAGLGGLFKQLLATAANQAVKQTGITQRSQSLDPVKVQAEVSQRVFDSIAQLPSLKNLRSSISNSILGTLRQQNTFHEDGLGEKSVRNLLFKSALPQTPILKVQDTIISDTSNILNNDPDASITNVFNSVSNLKQKVMNNVNQDSSEAPKQPGLMGLLAGKAAPGNSKPGVGGLFSNLKQIAQNSLVQKTNNTNESQRQGEKDSSYKEEQKQQNNEVSASIIQEGEVKLPPKGPKNRAQGIPLSVKMQSKQNKTSLSTVSQSIKDSQLSISDVSKTQEEKNGHPEQSKSILEDQTNSKELESIQKIQLLLQKATLGKIKELGIDVQDKNQNTSTLGESNGNPLTALLQRGLSKKIKTQEEKDAERIDYKIHRENAIIQKVWDKLDQNLKQRVGTGLSKGILKLLEFQHSDKNGDRILKGIISADYRRELANLKSKVHMIDDLFISKNGVKVKPERLKQLNRGEERSDNKLTEFEKMELRRKKMLENGIDIEREVMKIKIHENREFFRNLDNPENEVEKEVNDNIKADMRRKKKELIKFNLMDKPVLLKKLPLIDDLKFANMTVKSLALKKRIWKGGLGRYKATDLLKWFKVYEETKLLEIRKDLGKTEHGDGNSYYLKGSGGAPRKA